MAEFIKILLSLSLSGTLFLLVIFVLKHFYKNIFSRCWQYYILLLVALRFLLPVSLHYNLNVFLYKIAGNITVQKEIPVKNTDKENTKEITGEVKEGAVKNKEIEETGSNIITDIKNEIEDNSGEDNLLHNILKGILFIYKGLFYIWLVFLIVFVAKNVITYRRFLKYIKVTQEEVQDTGILELLAECRQKLGINKNIELYFNPMVSSPVLTGFWNPCIIIPADIIEKDRLFFVFLHELVHYKRKDMFYKWFIQTVICIHWFNPFIRLLGKEINKACELSCDEAVISILNKKQRRAYGDTLLLFARAGRIYRKNTGTVTLTEGAAQLKERLGAIMNFKKKSGIIKLSTMFITIIICFSFSLSGVYAATDKGNTGSDILKHKDLENINLKVNSNNYTMYYMQQGYYYNSYILEMGWNLNARAEKAYKNKINITLEDNSLVTVCFANNVKKYSKDQKVIKAIRGLANSLGDTYPVLEKALIARVTYVKKDDILDYARKYYKNKDLIGFSALFPKLDKKEQKKYLDKMYKSNKTAFFSSIMEYVDDDLVSLYTDKSSSDGKTAFYSILTKHTKKEEL
ncbi:MAG: M56 family metallopeptidase [Lachnospiraceae bacterium]|nr:M56 family metallopeptidase [Lachnospiraceae bacterium]